MDPIIQAIEETGVVAIIRRGTPFDAVEIARALAAGGVRVLEITLNSHRPLPAIEAVRSLEPGREGAGLVVGAGTVLTPAEAEAAIAAGAQFLVAPNVNPAVIAVARAAGVPMLPGIATPSEAVVAWQAGCELLKFFPAAALGPDYLKLMRDPLPDLKFVATGGVDTSNVAGFIAAGAVAIGVGSSVVGKTGEAPATITRRAEALIRAIAEARRG